MLYPAATENRSTDQTFEVERCRLWGRLLDEIDRSIHAVAELLICSAAAVRLTHRANLGF